MIVRKTIPVCFGKGRVALRVPESAGDWTVLRRPDGEEQAAGREAFRQAVQRPISSPPLADLIDPGDRVVIVTADGTRPLPNDRVIPWLLEELPVPPEQVTILLGNGAHRANTPDELRSMFGPALDDAIRIENHDAFDESGLRRVGQAADGTPLWLNRRYLEADKRLVIGLVEPHFFAGFSGGAKAVVPGVAGIETILAAHRPELIADPRSTWGTLAENPIRRLVDELVALSPPDFAVQVALNEHQQPEAFFAGDTGAAHAAACQWVRRTSFVAVDRRFPVVVTSNCGYPLDQNLYQAVKGIAAAARLVEPGGWIVLCAECSDGFGIHQPFAEIMQIGDKPGDILAWLDAQPGPVIDGWQAQIFAAVLEQARVAIYADVDAEVIRAVKCEPIAQLDAFLAAEAAGQDVAVLPDGFQTVPVLIP
ncbi:MAG: nickel-dependent lactate racemase [Candidatus Lernaella stagnicola]|nr:nickel-dependent lactate racemase [Candidatus Lernaella stagnicola]